MGSPWTPDDPDPHGECVAVIDQLSGRVTTLEQAVIAILKDPHGCAFCDSGKIRNPAKPHDEQCGFWLASVAMQIPLQPV